MNFDDRIKYDSKEYVAAIENTLDELKKYRFDNEYRNTLGDAIIEKLSEWDKEIRKRKEDPFTVVICGDFKRGKSTFINALLGEDVVTTNVTTETVTLNKISYGLHSNEAVLSGGKKLILTDEELQRDNLEYIIKQSNEPIMQINIYRPIEILKDITIIDTPGMDDSLKNFDELVDHALRQADAVIYLFSVNYPLSQNEQLFLKTNIIPQKYTSLYIVGNFADVFRNKDDYDRMTELINDRVSSIIPGQNVYLLSALDERCRQLGESPLNTNLSEVLFSSFDTLRTSINEMIQNKKDYVLPERMKRMLDLMISDLNSSIAALESGLEMNVNDIQAAYDEVNEKKRLESIELNEHNERIESSVDGMKAEAHSWINSVFDRLEKDMENLSLFSREDITKYYTFFCIDVVQEALQKSIDTHIEKIYNDAEAISEELTRSISKNTNNTEYNFKFSLESKTWTKGDNVGYIADIIGGMFGALPQYIGLAIGGAMREKEMQNNLPDVVKEIRLKFPEFRINSQSAIDEAYNKMLLKVKKALQEYYSDKIAFAEAQIEQASIIARQSEEQKAKTEGIINEIRSYIEKLEKI